MIDRRTLLRSLTPLAATLLTLGCRPDAPQAASNTAAKAVPVPLTESAAPVGAVVVVSVAGVKPGGEPVDAALQTEAQWGTEQASYRARVVADASALALRFEPVVTGVYAIVAVQPNAPKPPGREVEVAPPPVDSVASLSTVSRGGWAASGAVGRRRPEWAAAAVRIGPDGATVPLTLARP